MQEFNIVQYFGLIVLLHFTQAARFFRFSYSARTKTQATGVNSRKFLFLKGRGFLWLLLLRKVQIIPLSIIFALIGICQSRPSFPPGHQFFRPGNFGVLVLELPKLALPVISNIISFICCSSQTLSNKFLHCFLFSNHAVFVVAIFWYHRFRWWPNSKQSLFTIV